MIDLHTHVLPGIDDGAENLAEAAEMCRRAAADGCTALAATPHQRHASWWNADLAALAALRERVQEAVGETPRILAGAEIRVDGELLDAVDRGEGFLPLAGSRYLLIELDRQGYGAPPEEVVHELVVAGWRPLLAHPELLPWLAEDLPRLAELVALGAALQVTAMSVLGEFGRRPLAAVNALLDAGLAHVLASDCHGVERRPPGLSRARRRIAARWGEGYAARLTEDNPGAVVADRPLPEVEAA